DVALANESFLDPWVWVLLGGPDGLPATPSYSFPGVRRAWGVGDVNGDGPSDLILASYVVRSSQAVPETAYLVLGGTDALELDPERTVDFPPYAPVATICSECTLPLDAHVV